MTVSTTMIGQVSEYSVSDSGLFTTTLFNYYSAVAKSILDSEDPGLPTALYDHCHALLIVHLYVVKKGLTGYESTSAQGYTVSRKVGETAYLVEYRNILTKYRDMLSRAESSTDGSSTELEYVIRADAVMGDFQLDQAGSPIYFIDDPAESASDREEL